ncbi:hypothetical protein RKE38_12720 [Phycicoccus sp. M110.8]|jgi:hypothetical protein|uniref:hypothetical protein n=1 Tax=Phycicoccus sp. M110.8 TaxID=3075433 RepID=UPI0028FD9C55|nr:hypothetical protein [Phycicoccus sp. M110.8]MDU0314555.1 hypothetical protein [Phycicoccus sp. M110.8]HET8768983.1 hypothetical protein [Pedococcus sp.]
MSDYLALTTIRLNGSEATSALPGAPVVDDGWHPAPVAAARPVRRSVAATLRAAASVERRWADRLDPVCG